ncbi:solute carrier family 22 member 15-like [Tubulanus polymorphus]|uniref:solute carrier family 22 member 15-like n=1 Tax=Tubulanus polymorphus TaxID=672921 RepID=UPI003DA2231C
MAEEEGDIGEDHEAPKFDDLFDIIGGSCFVACLFTSFVIMEAAGAAFIKFFVLDVANPGWYCPNLEYNITGNMSGEEFVEGYCVNGKPCVNFTFNTKYISTVTEWELICDRAYIPKLMSSVFFAGVLIGALVASQVSDLFGRKPALLSSWGLGIIVQTLAMLAPSWTVYTALRFITGLSAGGIVSVTTVLLSEYLAPKWRTLLSYRVGWNLGPLILTVAGYTLRDYRKQCLAIGLWSLPIFPFAIAFLPESSRWLLQKKRFKEAERWLKLMARVNRQPVPDLSVLKVIADHDEKLRQQRQKYSYLHLFSTRKITIMSLTIMFGWFTCSTVSYGIESQFSGFTGDIYLNMLIIYGLMAAVRWVLVFLINIIGRRKGYPLFTGIVCILMIIVVVLDIVRPNESRLPQTALILTSKMIITGSWSVVLLFSTELYPTLMRNVSTGAGNVAARLAGVLAPQIALLATFNKAAPFGVYAGFTLISSILLYTILPETTGRPLPESLPTRKSSKKTKTRSDDEAPATATELEGLNGTVNS